LKNSFLYTLYVVPASLVLSFLIAVGLNQNSKFIRTLRVFYFVPTVTSSVAINFVWLWFFNPEYGLLNTVLGLLKFKKNLLVNRS